MTLELPWPPSINHYWRRNPHGGNYISGEGKTYLKFVFLIMRQARVQAIDGPVGFKVKLHPPNKLRRDLDNCLKVLIDAVAQGGAFGDDYQIKKIEAEMLHVVPNGKAIVELAALEDRLF